MVPTPTSPPDLYDDEAIALLLGRLGRQDAPSLLRARILGAGGRRPTEAASRRMAWGTRGLAIAAVIVVGAGIQVFARAAGGAMDGKPLPAVKLAVVEDPGLPLFTALEPGSWLGLMDEGTVDAGR